MCRMLGYLGGAVALGELVTAPAHSLVVQSYKPREMLSGTVNADGFGAALWLDDGKPAPAVYRTAVPIWADPNLAWMAERLRVTSCLAAVRSATPGMGFELSFVQPFSHGRLGFVHNGFISRFRDGPQRALRESLRPGAYRAVAGGSDSEHIFGLVLDALEGGAGSLADALRGALRRLGAICAAEGTTAAAAIILGDGAQLVACRWAVGTAPPSLYAAPFLLAAGGEGSQPLGSCVASEPLDSDDPRRWREIAAGQLLRADAAGFALETL